MKTIPDKVIDKTWKRIDELTPEQGQRLMEKMTEEQPFVVAYLLAVEETILSESERGDLVMIGLIIWQSLSTGKSPLRRVTQKDMETAEALNVTFLEELEAGSEIAYMDSMQKLMATYNQMPLLGAVIEAIMAGNEEEPDLAPENIGLTLLHLKTIIDCLDQ
jgi:hypothetical protein